MARGSDLLDDKTVKAKTAPGHYRDGRGLYLQVSVWGTKSWVMRYTVRGKTRGMGLGSYEDVSLKEARNEAERLRVVVREGRDPVEERRASTLGQRDKAKRPDYVEGTLNKAADQSFEMLAHTLPNPFAATPQSGTVNLTELLRLVEATPPRLFTTTFLTPVGEVTLLSANGGVGKTMFALMWAMCIAFRIGGLPVNIPEAASVLFVTAEDTALECGRRLTAIFAALHLNIAGSWANEGSKRFNLWETDGGPFWIETRENPAGLPTPLLAELERRIVALGVRQVFIDNASSVFHANHNDLTAVNAFIGALRRIASRTNCNIVLLAHVSAENATKGGAKTYYGSAAWHNGVRSRMFMELTPADSGVPEHVAVIHEKSNYGPKAEPFKLKRDPDTGVLSSFSNREIASAIDEGFAPFVEQLFAHIKEGFAKNEPVYSANSGPKTGYHCLSNAFPETYPEADKKAKEAVKRAIARLKSEGRIVSRHDKNTEVARHAVAEKVANSVIGQLTKTKAAIEAKAESLGYLGQAQAIALFSPKDGRAALDGEIRSWIRESMKTADGIGEVMAAARSDGNVAAVIYHSPRFLLGLSNETHASLKFDAIKRFAPEAYAQIENSGKLFDLAPRYDRAMQNVRVNFYNQTLADKAKLRVEV